METASKLFRSTEAEKTILARQRAMLDALRLPQAERRLPTCQGETFVLDCGPPDAAPVVLLHGSATSSIMWSRSLGAWSRALRVCAVDLIGEPGFSAPSRPPLGSDAHARWLDDVWRGLGLSQAAVVGASFGGWLGLDYAIRRPERVRSLVLLAPAGIAPVRPAYLLRVLPRMLAGRRGRQRAIELIFGVPPAELSDATREFFAYFELVLAGFRLRVSPIPTFSDAQLRALRMPVLALLGERDIVFSAARTRRRLRARGTPARGPGRAGAARLRPAGARRAHARARARAGRSDGGGPGLPCGHVLPHLGCGKIRGHHDDP
jgi:pimeloyl-ACP methyl ester carboxylesterase